MNEILFNVAQLVVIIAVTLATKYLIPWIKNNTKIAENDIVSDIVDVTVRYVEQTMGKPGMGKTRKEMVTQFIRSQLAERKIQITDEELNALIEAAVYVMNTEKPFEIAEEG